MDLNFLVGKYLYNIYNIYNSYNISNNMTNENASDEFYITLGYIIEQYYPLQYNYLITKII